jgi:hypothetical protein
MENFFAPKPQQDDAPKTKTIRKKKKVFGIKGWHHDILRNDV